MEGQTNTTENITFPRTTYMVGNRSETFGFIFASTSALKLPFRFRQSEGTLSVVLLRRRQRRLTANRHVNV